MGVIDLLFFRNGRIPEEEASTMHYGTEMNASQFGVKSLKVKVTVE